MVGSTLTVALSTSARAPAAAAPAWATVSGMSLGYWQQPAMKMPSVTVADRLELGMTLEVEAVGAAAEAEDLRDRLGVLARRQAGRQDHHVGRDAPRDAEQRVFGAHDEPALFFGRKGHVGDLGGAAAHEVHALVHEALVELLVALAVGAHVDVELVDLGLGQVLLDEVRELERVHAADARAELLVVLVAAADAVQDRDRLGLLAVLAA